VSCRPSARGRITKQLSIEVALLVQPLEIATRGFEFLFDETKAALQLGQPRQ
jgi:hypothetical protein